MKGAKIQYSDVELGWIKAMATEPRSEAHALFVQVFDRPDVNLSNFKALCTRKGWRTGRTGRFPKGNLPFNTGRKGVTPPGSEKGWFKKGQRSGVATKLYKPIGTERISKNGYLERKINDDFPPQRRWRAVQLIRWEQLHGPIPAGHALKCRTRDILNTDPSNWVCVHRGVLARLNGIHGRGFERAPDEVKPTILAASMLEQAAYQVRKADRS